jgi:PTH1 family peptidyl-tRNA hydrolase
MKLIIGLGNPGKKYNHTRHNIGFWVLDNYLGNVSWQEKFSALYYENIINNEKIIYLKPQTFMNNSGLAVREVCNYFNIKPEEILVIHDDLDMEFGKIKIKMSSSSGGHNGIKSIIENIKSEDFYHFKMGINSNKEMDAKDFVLKKFSLKEQLILKQDAKKYNDIIDLFIKNDILVAMNKYN